MSKGLQRIIQMEQIIREQSAISVKELARRLLVSEMTIRRDLVELEKQSPIRNIRGLIVYDDSLSRNHYSISSAVDANQEEKIRIGNAAASMVQDGDVIMLDIGSSAEYVARALSPELKATVICTTYNALSFLTQKSNLKIHCTGGYFHPDTQLLESPESLSFLNRIRATKLFASAAGIHQQLGVTCANNYELPIKKALMESSAERILLADSSKFGHVQSTCFTNISYYHKIITDIGITPEWEEYILSKNIELIKV